MVKTLMDLQKEIIKYNKRILPATYYNNLFRRISEHAHNLAGKLYLPEVDFLRDRRRLGDGALIFKNTKTIEEVLNLLIYAFEEEEFKINSIKNKTFYAVDNYKQYYVKIYPSNYYNKKFCFVATVKDTKL